MKTNNSTSVSALSHLSVFTQYIIPFGNFVTPLLIWAFNGKKSDFVNHHSKQVINFQLSLFLYSVILVIIAVPLLLYTLFKNIAVSELTASNNYFEEHWDIANISGLAIIGIVFVMLIAALKIIEIFLVIYGAVKASNGEIWNYPMSINFIK